MKNDNLEEYMLFGSALVIFFTIFIVGFCFGIVLNPNMPEFCTDPINNLFRS